MTDSLFPAYFGNISILLGEPLRRGRVASYRLINIWRFLEQSLGRTGASAGHNAMESMIQSIYFLQANWFWSTGVEICCNSRRSPGATYRWAVQRGRLEGSLPFWLSAKIELVHVQIFGTCVICTAEDSSNKETKRDAEFCTG